MPSFWAKTGTLHIFVTETVTEEDPINLGDIFKIEAIKLLSNQIPRSLTLCVT